MSTISLEKSGKINIFNRWIVKRPYEWSKLDTFYWLCDWAKRNNVSYKEIEKLVDNLFYGRKLLEKNFEYFINYSNHGLYIYEDFQILISSFYCENLKNYKEDSLNYRKVHSSFKRVNVPKVFKFIQHVLSDPTNPEIIKWRNYEKQIFSIIKPIKLAQIWGKFSENINMTYSSFSRSLRYCYKLNYLKHLEEKFTYQIKV